MKVRMVTTKIRTIFLLSLTWVLAVASNAPYNYYASLIRIDGREFCWSEIDDFILVYSFIFFIVWYCLPLVIIICLYCKIMKTLRRIAPSNDLQQTQASIRRRIQNKKIMKILLSIVVAFFISWTLYYMYINFAVLLNDQCFIIPMLSNYLFPLLNTVVNPIVLFLFGTNYHAALGSWCVCQCKCSRGSIALGTPWRISGENVWCF